MRAIDPHQVQVDEISAVRGPDAVPSRDMAGLEAVMVRRSAAGSFWTGVSRVTGLGQSITVAAVLGATYLGNTYQAINSLPNLVYYQLLAGSLFSALLVPAIVQYVDADDRRRVQTLVGGFLGALLLVGMAFAALLVVVGKPLLHLLTLGVSDRAAAVGQGRAAWILLLLFVPQIPLYVIAGTGAAVMNAHGRFALAAGAPAIENAGMITVLLLTAAVFGTAPGISRVSHAELLLLGMGTTAAVGLHAAAQWWGARSSHIRIVPSTGWHDPQVRAVIRRLVPSLGYTALAATLTVSVLVAANRVRGGVVGFQLGMNFFYLPTAIVTWPIARSLLPDLARYRAKGWMDLFRRELFRGVAMASFISVPIAAAYIALSFPIARAVAFGELDTSAGVRMVAFSLAALGIGVVGETWFILGTFAFYAAHDAHTPLRAMIVRVGVALTLMPFSWLTHGPNALAIVGISVSAGSLAGALYVALRLRAMGAGIDRSLVRSIARTLSGSLLMLLPAYAVIRLGGSAHSESIQLAVIAGAGVVGVITYFVVQAAWRTPEIEWLKAAFAGLRSGGRS